MPHRIRLPSAPFGARRAAAGSATPAASAAGAPAAAAATVAVLRPAAPGFEVLLLGRTRTMDFAPGAHVFPGGSVDPSDDGVEGAAVRETFEECGLRLRAEDLVPWSRWITPEAAPRRYDTWFFVAAVPAGQSVAIGAAESDVAEWLRPALALDAARAGRITLLPPTAVTLAELASFASVAEVLAECRPVDARMPVVVVEDGQVWLEFPEGVEYPL